MLLRPVLISVAVMVLALLGGCGGGAGVSGNELPVRCLDEPDEGPCRARKPAYYYDYRTNRCKVFYYGGCQGRVPFETEKACTSTCVGNPSS